MIQLTSVDIGRINPLLFSEELEVALGYPVQITAHHVGGTLIEASIARPDGNEFSTTERDAIYAAVAAHNPDGLSDEQQDEKNAQDNVTWAKSVLEGADLGGLDPITQALIILARGG